MPRLLSSRRASASISGPSSVWRSMLLCIVYGLVPGESRRRAAAALGQAASAVLTLLIMRTLDAIGDVALPGGLHARFAQLGNIGGPEERRKP
jgi:hypothetical protein